MSVMNVPAEITQLPPSDALNQWLQTLQAQAISAAETERALEQQTAECAHQKAELTAAHLKIQALMLELARYKRLSFGRSSEASSTQLSLFEETRQSDIAAVQEEL